MTVQYLGSGRHGRFVTPMGVLPLNPHFPRPTLLWTPLQHDHITGRAFSAQTYGSAEIISAAEFGQATQFRGGSAHYAPWIPYFAPPATVLILWRPNLTGANHTFFSFGGGGAGNGWKVGGTPTDVYIVTWGGVADYASTLSFSTAKTACVAFALGGGGSNYDLIIDGAYCATVSTGGAINAPTDPAAIGSANALSAPIAGVQAYLGLVVVWNSRLPRGMLCELTANPRLLFTQRPSIYRAPAAAFSAAWAGSANSVIQPGAMAA